LLSVDRVYELAYVMYTRGVLQRVPMFRQTEFDAPCCLLRAERSAYMHAMTRNQGDWSTRWDSDFSECHYRKNSDRSRVPITSRAPDIQAGGLNQLY
jgi:hypothetical protein